MAEPTKAQKCQSDALGWALDKLVERSSVGQPFRLCAKAVGRAHAQLLDERKALANAEQAGYERGRREEKEACAKHVYQSAVMDELWAGYTAYVNEYIRAVAAEIARGEHRK